jgi:hypothetical protein
MLMNKPRIIATGLAALLALSAGTSTPQGTEQKIAKEQLKGFLAAQPVPTFAWSQLRQNLIELETAQADTTATTSFFFNQGVADPITVCPSSGFPIPPSYQLTNPEQISSRSDGSDRVAVPQIESTGVYTAGSTGTYVICIDGTGDPYAFYWEGFVSTVTGPAQWKDGQVTLTGKPTVDFTNGQNP